MFLPQEIEQNREAICLEVERFGAELLEIRFRRSGGRNVLEFTVDKAGGVTLDDCAEINRGLGLFFDALVERLSVSSGEDVLRGSYILEVNSPGLDRPLRTEKDFSRVLGERLRVTYRATDGRVLTETGELTAAEAGQIEFRTQKGIEIRLAVADVVKAVRDIRFGGK